MTDEQRKAETQRVIKALEAIPTRNRRETPTQSRFARKWRKEAIARKQQGATCPTTTMKTRRHLKRGKSKLGKNTRKSLSVGVRNSIDKSFPIGFAAGSRVFVCDNLAFSAELLIKRRHTLNGLKAFGSAIANGVASLASFRDGEESRIRVLTATELDPVHANHLILSAFRRGIINSQQIADVCNEWEKPRHDDFAPRTAWSLLNCFTEILKPRAISNPQAFVASTIRLNGLLLPEAALAV